MDDILALKLDADWVVLSACNTAGGDGEGAEALRRSMLAVMKAEAREGGLRYSYGHPFFSASHALVGDGG